MNKSRTRKVVTLRNLLRLTADDPDLLQVCGLCRYHLEGECHFEPPRIVMTRPPSDGSRVDHDEPFESVRPDVSEDDPACSHFVPAMLSTLEVKPGEQLGISIEPNTLYTSVLLPEGHPAWEYAHEVESFMAAHMKRHEIDKKVER